MNKKLRTSILIVLISGFISACVEEHSEVSYSLVNHLRETKLDCAELRTWDFTDGFLVKEDLDGWGVLIISRANEPDMYDLSLVSHGHERAFETRKIVCE